MSRLVHLWAPRFLAASERTRRSRSGSLPPPDLLPEPRPELHIAVGGGEVVAGGDKCGEGVGNRGGSATAGDRVLTRKRAAEP